MAGDDSAALGAGRLRGEDVFLLALKIYEVVYILTGGGPAHASETIVSYLYTTTFDGMLYGYGMTIAVAEFVFAALISLLSMRLSRRNAD